MSNYTIISHHHHYLEGAARLYEHAYALKDAPEGLNAYETALSIVVSNWQRESFVGVLAVTAEQEVIGIAYGFETPQDEASRVNQIIRKRLGVEWVENTFMLEVFGMHFEHRSPELAEALHTGLMARVREAGFMRARMRLELPRLDGLEKTLLDNGWAEFEELKGLPHLKWLGKLL